VKALRSKGVSTVAVEVDDSLFTGPRTAPGWPSTYVSTGVVSPVSALSADSGKVSAESRVRSADPAIAAGRWFARRLEAAGLTVTGEVGRTDVGSVAEPIASVQSPTVADLVERMLTASDNDLAEALAHLSGLVVAQDASFAGGARATQETLQELGVPVSGLDLVDGSGLSRENRVTATTLAATLAAAVRDAPPTGATAGILWPTTTGLPIAGATGTLADRFDTEGTDAGRGVVRGKTGTLSGVVTLAGAVVDEQGRMRVFVFLADASPGPLLDAQAALDRAATAVVTSP
jgi:D-alanyl-D-alanine carboxypeptidase/D-alanyl-D-alanine-endopeptidase (penicillin-binding protein 4)